MTQLKTLKECIIYTKIGRENAFQKEHQDRIENEESFALALKKEAIKWVKEYRRVEKLTKNNNRLIEGKCAGLIAFFNITDKELGQIVSIDYTYGLRTICKGHMEGDTIILDLIEQEDLK